MNRKSLSKILLLTFLFSCVVCPEPIPAIEEFEKIDRVVEEFRRQVPWFRISEKSNGMNEAIGQPQSYLPREQKEESESQGVPLPPYFYFDQVRPIYYTCIVHYREGCHKF